MKPSRSTRIKDDFGNTIKVGDILSIIHQGESFPVREFRRKVVYSIPDGGFMLVEFEHGYKEYLGEVRNDPNFIRCKVVGNDDKLLDIPQGCPPGMTQKQVDKLFEKYRKRSRLKK